jgi:hypothetical protein
MTPEQKIKHAVLLKAAGFGYFKLDVEITSDNIDEVYESHDDNGSLQDARNEIRYGQVETEIACQWNRHYESKSVAAEMPDGSWVGWTHWYGGGKHGEPEAIDWMDEAYNLTFVEKVITVKEFSKVE